jgi:hypothetical protein
MSKARRLGLVLLLNLLLVAALVVVGGGYRLGLVGYVGGGFINR